MIKKFIMYLQQMRCKSCNRLLGLIEGKAEIKCPKCGTMNVLITIKAGGDVV